MSRQGRQINNLRYICSFTEANRTYWVCRCDCGKFTHTRSGSSPKDCGCRIGESLSGQSIGPLIVVEDFCEPPSGVVANCSWAMYKCSVCGNEKKTRRYRLTLGREKCQCQRYSSDPQEAKKCISGEMSKCTGCSEVKPVEEFHKGRGKNGAKSRCKACRKEESRAYYHRDPEEQRRKVSEYQKRNRESCTKRQHEWKERNIERYRLVSRENAKRRYRSDPCFNLKCKVSQSIRNALKKMGKVKSSKTFDSLPYTPEEMYSHLMSTMPDGYTEDDLLSGKIHIDHIVPHCTFRYEDMESEEFLACWSLSNLQLLTAEENIRKRDSLNYQCGGIA